MVRAPCERVPVMPAPDATRLNHARAVAAQQDGGGARKMIVCCVCAAKRLQQNYAYMLVLVNGECFS